MKLRAATAVFVLACAMTTGCDLLNKKDSADTTKPERSNILALQCARLGRISRNLIAALVDCSERNAKRLQRIVGGR